MIFWQAEKAAVTEKFVVTGSIMATVLGDPTMKGMKVTAEPTVFKFLLFEIAI
jgi:hypothetical protein